MGAGRGGLLCILQVTPVNQERGSQGAEWRSVVQRWELDMQETLRLAGHFTHHPLDTARRLPLLTWTCTHPPDPDRSSARSPEPLAPSPAPPAAA